MSAVVENRQEFIVAEKYQLKRKIGSGSFGEIYLAVNIHNNVEYAVKIEPARVSSFKGFS